MPASARVPARPSRPSRFARHRWRWSLGLALTAGAAAALAGAGAGLLNGLAALRGHRAATGVAYGADPAQRFDLYRPRGALAEPDKTAGSPLVIFVYGGSWDSGSRAQYRFAGEALAAQGFTVMVPDYRLYPATRYPGFVQDCARAVAYGLEHARELGADPRRVFLYGHSAGAYNVAMLALDPRWLRAVGHAPAELAGWVGLAGPYDFLPIGDAGVKRVFDWPATAPDTQPIRHVDDLAQPVPAFIGAAAHDTLVDPDRNSQALAARMRARGTAVTLRRYERASHALLVGALQWPLTAVAPVLSDTAAFIREAAPAPASAAAITASR